MARGEAPAPVGEMDDDGTGWTKTIWIPRIDQADIELMPDEEGMTKRMAIKERAITAGEQNLPAVKDQILDTTQMEICRNVFDGILLLNQFLAEQLNRAVEVASSQIPSSANLNRLRSRIDGAVDDVIESERRALTDLCATRLRADLNLRGFAARNDRLAPASIKDNLIVPFSTLALMFVIESLVNGFVLAEVSEQGVMGGAVIAGVISAVNIGLGLISGLIGWRNAFHVKLWRRIAGWALAGMILVAAFCFNLLVAHFREAAELMAAGDAAEISMAVLNENTIRHLSNAGAFGLSSPLAWGLFVLGMAIHVVATKEGYEDLTDPYWGYAPIARRARDASASYDEAFEAVRDRVREGVEQIEAEAHRAAQRAESAVQTVTDLKNLALQRRQEVLDSEDVWVVTGNALLKMYRDQNLRIRDKGPAYFDHYPSAEDYRTGTFGAGLRRSAQVESQEKVADRHLKALDDLITATSARAKDAADLADELHRIATGRIRALDGLLTREEEVITAAAMDRVKDDAESEAAA
ncbi:MAG: hypothetical protein U1E18_06055 [Brevundimonas sp.]|uniref:hypothetical protein n=1 Tax=Brevundimonas sp. TaxID=1871086 RepID=UPI002ABC9B53|nr:hypothetical protein [Brevundimonas sp.]MDZ4109148.1 hypothetical protein [Brevundimonas sp.]